MADINLKQDEADTLIQMPKVRDNDDVSEFPIAGGAVTVPLLSEDRREKFLLDITRSRIKLVKGTYQNRARGVVVLLRLDFGGPSHRNPDDSEIECPHLHRYREGYGDKWAEPVPTDAFTDIADPWQALQDFMRYCNVIETPEIRRGLFV